MPLSLSERQRKYRKRIKTGEIKRFQVMLSSEDSSKFETLCKALQCNKTELIKRLIDDEWGRRADGAGKG